VHRRNDGAAGKGCEFQAAAYCGLGSAAVLPDGHRKNRMDTPGLCEGFTAMTVPLNDGNYGKAPTPVG